MKVELKSFEFKVEDTNDSKGRGIIRGFASTFGNIDLGDDVVDPGAFKKTIQESKGKVPILADHDPSKLIGWNLRAEETDKGLMVEGEINLKTKLGEERYELAKQALEVGAKMGLSIGYGVIKAMPDKDRPSIRRLKELKLYEYSLVTFPMNTDAMVTAAKSWVHGKSQQEALEMVAQAIREHKITIEQIQKALGGNPEPFALNADPTSMGQSLDRLLNLLQKST